MKLISHCVAIGLMFTAALITADEPVAFEKDVLPIFESRCAACHFPDADELKGNLDLSTFASALKGGKSGAVIVPGRGDESLLVKLIEGKADPQMPPKKFKPLKPEEIELIKKWINEGAKSDASAGPRKEIANASPAANDGPLKKAFKGLVKSAPKAEEKPQPPAPAAETAKDAPSASAANPAFQPISALAFSPAGDLLARGGLHKVDLLSVNPATGETKPLCVLDGHADLVRAVAFSPDGAFLAAAGGKPARKGEIKIWNVKDHSLVRTITGHKDNIYDVAYSPDGKLIATCSYDKMIKLWSAETGEEVHNLKDHVDAVYDIAFSPDGKHLASASGDRTVKIWDVEFGKRLFTFSDSLGPVQCVTFSPDGKLVAAGGADKMIRIWDFDQSVKAFTQTSLTGATQIKSSFAHDAPLLRIIYSPDGKTIYTTSEDKRIKVWNAETLIGTEYDPQSDWVMAMALSPSGAQLAVGRYDTTGAIYEAATGKLLSGDGAPRAAADAGDGKDGKKVGRKKVTSLDVENVVINGKIPASLQSVSPRVVSRGTTTTLTLSGISLDDPEIFIDGSFSAKLISNEKLPIPELKRGAGETGAFIVDNAQPHKLTYEVKIAPDAAIGPHYVMLRTPNGMTEAQELVIPPWPDTGEAEPNNSMDKAQPILFPATIPGAMNGSGDFDLYRFDAKKGQELVFVFVDSTMDTPLLRLLDSAGKPLVTSDAFPAPETKKPRLGYRIETDGVYMLEITNKSLGGGNYRLSAGEFPYVYAYEPLGIPAGPPVKIHVKGFNIGGGDEMQIDPPDDAAPGQTMPLPLPGFVGNPIPAPVIAIGPPNPAGEIAEAEPNDAPEKAQTISFPSVVNARIASGDANDEDYYRFPAKKDQKILIETMAARVGGDMDSIIEILDETGQPLEWATVRCVAQTIMTLSDRDSASAGIRLENWTDLKMNDYVMIGSEIIRVGRLPGYADEDCSFVAWSSGQRRGYFGTTPEAHAVNTQVYKAEIHPPGSKFPPNGLPAYHIYWRNDDGFFEGAPPGDSYLEFAAPRDGDFIIKVRDANKAGGEGNPYRLILRAAKPDFDFSVGPYWPNVPDGGSASLDVRIRRKDGFDAPVKITAEGLPEGFSIRDDVVLGNEENIDLALVAAPGAKSTDHGSTVKFTAHTMLDGKEVTREARIGAITVRANPDIKVRNQIAKLAIKPGETVTLPVKLDRFNGFTSRVPLSVLNLPFGVRVIDTGLNGILVREDETDRTITIYSEPWAAPITRKIYVQARIETRSAQPTFVGEPVELQVGEGNPDPMAVVAAKGK